MLTNFQKMHKTGAGNPLLWPSVTHERFLLTCHNYDTAYVVVDYPFGSTRCLMRVWHEQADSGVQKKNWRLLSQTTVRSWNVTYTQNLRALDRTSPEQLRAFDIRFQEEYERIRMTPQKPFWNKANLSTYGFFQCWELFDCRPKIGAGIQDRHLAVRPFCLYVNSSYQDLKDFLDKIIKYSVELTPNQIVSLQRMETFGRQMNKEKWPNPVAWEAWGLPPRK